jgi:sec-independent protein translocase protein TatA
MFRNPLTDVIVVLVIVLLVMGPKRLPQIGKGLGQGMREFKEGITGESKSDDDGEKLTLSKVETPPAERPAPPAAAPRAESGSERGT